MTTYRLIRPDELAAFAEELRQAGWNETDFELEEDVFDPATAEVEAALGVVGVRCLSTEAGATYPFGAGRDWVGDFIGDLHAGRMGAPQGASG